MSENSKKSREITLIPALGIFGSILAIIVVGRLILGFDVALLLMFCGMFSTIVYTCFYGYGWGELFDKGVVPMVAKATGAILILLTVGPLIAAWMASGTIPYLIYIGLKMLSPRIFLAAGFLICCLSSCFTGTSWGTAATFGVALMGIAHGLGVSLPATAGAIIGGAYFGDKLSPISDTTVLAAAVAEVDVVDHIRSMLCSRVYHQPYCLWGRRRKSGRHDGDGPDHRDHGRHRVNIQAQPADAASALCRVGAGV